MTRLASIVCGAAVSAEMTVRYVAPAPTGEKLFIRGVIAHSTGKAMKIS